MQCTKSCDGRAGTTRGDLWRQGNWTDSFLILKASSVLPESFPVFSWTLRLGTTESQFGSARCAGGLRAKASLPTGPLANDPF